MYQRRPAAVAFCANHERRHVLVGFTLAPWPSVPCKDEREGRTETAEGHQRTTHHFPHPAAYLPTTIHSHHPSITSASPSQQPYTSHIHIHHVQSSPPIPTALHLKLLGPRGSDWAGVLTSGLRGLPSCTALHNQTQTLLCCRFHGRPYEEQYLFTSQLHLLSCPSGLLESINVTC